MSRIQRVVSVVSLLWFAPAVWAQPVSVPPEVLEQDWGEEVHCYAGAPKKEGLRLLHTSGYTVGYDSNRRLPAWVAYPLSANQVATETAKRPSRFSSDTRVGNPVRHDDYTHSGFDRGHMAPNMAIGLQFGPQAQRETFLLTNICPQEPSLNRGIWKNIEQKEQDAWRRQCCELWTMVGPVFRPTDPALPSGIRVPSSYWRITLDEDPGRQSLRAICLHFEESATEGWRYTVVSIDAIEDLTGIDFFTLLPDEVELALESGRGDSNWWSSGWTTGCDRDGPTNLARVGGAMTPLPPSIAREIPKAVEEEPGVGSYWITSSSGIRHNSSCRWYKKSKGQPGTASEGRPCKVCGG